MPGVSSYHDGKLRCKSCKQRVAAQLMTVAVRPGGSRQYYCPPCDDRRWDPSVRRDVLGRYRPRKRVRPSRRKGDGVPVFCVVCSRRIVGRRSNAWYCSDACKWQAINHERPRIELRVSPELHERLRRLAEQERCPLNTWLMSVLEKAAA